MIQETALTTRHQDLGAKMTDFAGYLMPLMYSNVSQEHLAVRARCGIFDVSHMGEFIIKGKEALDLIQLVTSNDASTLKVGAAQYTCMLNHQGGIVDDLLVYRLDEDRCNAGEMAFMLVVNAANIQKDLSWIKEHNRFDTDIIDISERTGLLAVQGPMAAKLLQPFTNLPLKDIPSYHFQKADFAQCPNVLISATGYTGSGGFEIYADRQSIPQIWDELMADTNADIQLCGLAARDTLRLEMGYSLYGNDIDDQTSPLEAGLGWITKLRKKDFIGKNVLAKQKRAGVVRKLVGFELTDRRIARRGYLIEDKNGRQIGAMTSGTFSPSLQKPIGMGYVERACAQPGNHIRISTGRKQLEATIVGTPFLKL